MEISRRKALGLIGSSALASTAGCSSLSDITFPVEIDVRLFTQESLQGESFFSPGPFFKAKLMKAYGKEVFPSLPEGVTVNTTVSEYSIPNVFPNDGIEEAYEQWKDFVENELPEEEKSPHANILLSDVTDSNYRGWASIPSDNGKDKYPCGILSVKPTALSFMTEDDFVDKEYLTNPESSPLNTFVHEVGHLLGLDHSQGTVDKWAEERQTVFVTPMLSSYILKEEFQDEKANAFSQPYPDIPEEELSQTNLYYKVGYNEKIERDNLAY